MRNALTSDTMLANDPDDQFKGTLYLDLKVHHIIFNQKGKYNVKLSINGSRGDPRKVKLYLNGSKQSIFEYEYISEPCFQDGLDNPCMLDDNQFRFEMPEGEWVEALAWLSNFLVSHLTDVH